MSSDSETRIVPGNSSSFLSLLLNHLNQTNSDSLETLERENLHFIISDNLISTFEEIKCDVLFNNFNTSAHPRDNSLIEDDRTIVVDPTDKVTNASDDTHSTSTPESSSSSYPSSYHDGTVFSAPDWPGNESDKSGYIGETDSSRDYSSYDINTRAESNHESGLYSLTESISNLSDISSCLTLDRECKMFSDMSIAVGPLDDSELGDNSAESVAAHLLSHYSTRSLPRHSSCEPLLMLGSTSPINENNETINHHYLNGNKSLPIHRTGNSCYDLFQPDSLVTSTNNSLSSHTSLHHVVSPPRASSTIKLRGNSQWAPLRPQLIFNIQRPTDKYLQWLKQNQRCAGCGSHIDSKCKEFHRVLYCYYTGKWFCRLGCHSGRKALIPGHIINKWDFNSYPVSNFAVKFIERIRNEPLFHVNDLNPGLYKKVKQLTKMYDFRYQLRSLKEYILTCKNSSELVLYYVSFEPKHLVNDDVHLYSLEDLLSLKRSKKLLEKCWNLVKLSINHVSRCDYCKARGFICELCTKSDLIFPFEIGRVYQCCTCKACYHLFCYKRQSRQECSKCSRIQARRASSNQDNGINNNLGVSDQQQQQLHPQQPLHQQLKSQNSLQSEITTATLTTTTTSS